MPEVVDFLAFHGPEALLLAAGGIGDARGLAAALMLGADGVLIGTRFWASREALVAKRHHEAILEATGDDTIRTTKPDIARQIKWPPAFTARSAETLSPSAGMAVKTSLGNALPSRGRSPSGVRGG